MSEIDTAGRISRYWPSQAAAREIVAEHGCKVCTWQTPGEIYDVAGDLWCCHCVREAKGLDGLDPALIPTP